MGPRTRQTVVGLANTHSPFIPTGHYCIVGGPTKTNKPKQLNQNKCLQKEPFKLPPTLALKNSLIIPPLKFQAQQFATTAGTG